MGRTSSQSGRSYECFNSRQVNLLEVDIYEVLGIEGSAVVLMLLEEIGIIVGSLSILITRDFWGKPLRVFINK